MDECGIQSEAEFVTYTEGIPPMIIDRLEYADRYVSLHPLFGNAFRYLHESAQDLEPGRHEIIGDQLFAICERAVGRGEENSPVESHRRYIDIQFVVSGEERFGWIPVSHCHQPTADFDSQRDIGFFHDRPMNWVKVPAGFFVIFFPEDGHAPLAGEGDVHKVVVKVAQSLQQVLEDLHAELVLAAQLHPENKERLQASILEIERLVAAQETPHESLPDRLREMARELEQTHPRLTHVVGRVADALAQIGI